MKTTIPTQHSNQLLSSNNPRKRIKTSRACDSCRAKKIRCEPLNKSQSTPPTCTQCHNHSIECTWFLPIALTRFKPRHSKLNNQQTKQPPPPSTQTQNYPQPETQDDDSLPRRQEKVDPRSSDHRIYGNTSMSYIMHSTRSFPSERLGSYDTQYFQALQIENNGDGFIKVYDQNSSDQDQTTEDEELHHSSSSPIDHHTHSPPPPTPPPPPPSSSNDQPNLYPPSHHHQSNPSEHHPKTTNHQISPQNLTIQPNEIDQLLSYYFTTISPHAPMINQYQFHYLTRKRSHPNHPHPPSILGSSSHSKLLLYSLCGLAAMDHRVSSHLRIRVRRTIESFYRQNEILARCDIKSILSLLVIGFSLEFEIPEAGRICWNAVGTAIRMAQSLGLHRQIESTRHSIVHQEMRRRVWSCCVITDRWASAVFGLPMAIDLSDSDNHLTLNDPEYLLHLSQNDQLYLSHFALQSLSILLGKILKGLYTPSGILHLKDELMVSLMDQLKQWHSQLAIISDPNNLGYLRLAAVSVEFLLFRPFMRAEPSGPKTLQFEMVEEDFDRLISRARKAINWTSSNSHVVEGQIIGQYSFFVSCLVQYHSYIGQGSLEALDALGEATKLVKSVQNPDCFVRKRVHDIVQALFSTAVINRQEVERSRLARSSQLVPSHCQSATTHQPNVSLPPLNHLENPNLSNHAAQPSEIPAQIKLTKQPMWWWDISGIYDINSTLDVLSDPPSSWDGLIHPTGLINWNSWSGSSLDKAIVGSQTSQSALPQHIQQLPPIESGPVHETGLNSGPVHLNKPWLPTTPATNTIPTTLPQTTQISPNAFDLITTTTTTTNNNNISSVPHPVYQDLLSHTRPELLDFLPQNFTHPTDPSSAPASQTDFRFPPVDLYSPNLSENINLPRRFSSNTTQRDNLDHSHLSDSFLIHP